jgi:glucose/arabinose dehydrogenase
MKKLAVILLGFIIISGLGYFSYLRILDHYHITPSIIKKVVQPPKQDISVLLKKGDELKTPLSLPDGYSIGVFANLKDYGMPRVLAFDKNGVLFSSITGQGGILALPDKDNDGVADEVITVLAGLNRPHGILFYNDYLYIAESDKVVRYNYNEQNFTVTIDKVLFTLPNGGRHFTRTIKMYEDKLYTSVGSSCDVCDENNTNRAAVLVSNSDGSDLKIYANGLRNTVFFAFDEKGIIWGNDMGRDFLGDNLPPDELNIIASGKDYGWPRCYGQMIRDNIFRSWESINSCNATTAPVYEYPAHVAPLGITFINSILFPVNDNGNLLVSFHGSWNASTFKGYKVVKLTIKDEKVIRMEDFISGWISDGDILGRPVDLIFGSDGVLYLSDDKAGLIYIVTKSQL